MQHQTTTKKRGGTAIHTTSNFRYGQKKDNEEAHPVSTVRARPTPRPETISCVYALLVP